MENILKNQQKGNYMVFQNQPILHLLLFLEEDDLSNVQVQED